MKERLIKIADNFKRKRIGVIGDLMLDQFIWGEVERISPEAPVPVVLFTRETFTPGGAGNTAHNIATLGGKVFVVGLVGKDKAAKQLLHKLKMSDVDITGIIKAPNRVTTQKVRIIVRNQQVVRVDREDTDYINNRIEKKVINFVASHIKDWDVLAISDYAKGLITEKLAKEIIKLAKEHGKPILVSTKRAKHAPYFKNCTFLISNYKEAAEIAGVEDLESAGKVIQEQLNCNVLITQGPEGMTLFAENKAKYFPTKKREVFDVGGAGDTVMAAFVLALVSGANFEEAAIIANHAAGVVVGKIGTATISPEELKSDLQNSYE
ncbi:MAG: D-glycero-beta-D-manno-heptose-7-phosphate kinase [Candidatus Atribacteria bacterium]